MSVGRHDPPPTGRPLIIQLQGRVGNQLFQFAMGHATAGRIGAPLRFSSRLVADGDLLLPGLVGAAYHEATRSHLARVGIAQYEGRGADVVAAFARYRVRTYRKIVGRGPPILYEDDGDTHRVVPRFLTPESGSMLCGFFQNEDYFTDDADAIDAAITLPRVDNILGATLPRPLVSVSFRRGDYNVLGWALPLEYYTAALARLTEHVRPGTLVLTGDDPVFLDLVSPILAGHADQVVNATRLAPGVAEQLAVLAGCDHSVLANSSFSWWGAWLAERRSADQHLVFTPEGWIGGDDCCPERWSRIGWD